MGRLPARLLVDLPNWLGDLVHALPALRAMVRANREGDTTLVLPEAHLPLGHAFGVRMVARPPGAGWTWARRTIGASFDVALTARHSTRAKLLLAATTSARRLASAGRGAGWFGLETFPVCRSRHQRHDLDGALALLGLPPVEDEAGHLPLSAACRRAGKQALGELTAGQGGAVLCPGARHLPAKRYPAERFAAVGQALRRAGWAVLVAGGPGEERLLDSVAARCGGTAVPTGWGLDLIAGLLAASDVAVGNDSGLTHLAAAVGCPTVVLHGPTDPARTGAAGRIRTLVEAGPGGLAAMCPQRVAWAAQMAVAGEGLHVSRPQAMIPFGGGPLAQLAEQGTLNP